MVRTAKRNREIKAFQLGLLLGIVLGLLVLFLLHVWEEPHEPAEDERLAVMTVTDMPAAEL